MYRFPNLPISRFPNLPISRFPNLPISRFPNLPIYHQSTNLPTLVSLSTCLLISLSLGALGAINTWDLPTYFLLVAGAFTIVAWRRRSFRSLVGSTLLTGLIGAAAVAAYWPFYAHYQARVGGDSGPLIGRYLGWVHESSPLGPWLVVWGFFLFLALSFVLVEWVGSGWGSGWKRINGWGSPASEPAPLAGMEIDRASTPPSLKGKRMVGSGLLGLALLLFALNRPTAALVVAPLGLALAFAFRRWAPPEDAFLMLLLALGLGIVTGTELIYLRDFLDGGDWYRMNTLFKFSVPAWLFLGLAGGVMLPRVWAVAGRRPAWLRWPWRGLALLLLIFGLAFLPLGIPARVRDRFPGPRPARGTLDGTAFMTVGRYNWPDAQHAVELAYDYLAIHWLLDHVTGTPVVAEAPAGGYTIAGQNVGYDYYRAGGLRVASLTGFPTFVGQHQYEQRPGEQVSERTSLGQTFFRTTDIARARELMRELRVGYIYVGALERTLFTEDSLRKFEVMTDLGDLDVVYRNPQVTIYRVANSK
ncbi:MAG: hypothetical protein CVU38_13365 [Chloroflexi bacterium HGW-Chloroflexi-1]|nr:MAG: hypothetical protein CVU38_13365 [Chloroflexi bacterium HGW-Chloroflexi-1]